MADGLGLAVLILVSAILGGLAGTFKERLRSRGGEAAAEASASAANARAGAILDAAVDGIVTIDERGIIHGFNRAAERIFGYTVAEVMGRNVNMLMPQPYCSAHDDYLLNYLSTGQPRVIGSGREVEGRRKDGSTFPMDLAVGESTIGGGRIFAGIVRDISERKQVEESLRASEERFRTLVEGVRDYAIITLDASGRIATWNAGAERLYGWTSEEVVGETVSRFYPLEAIARNEHEHGIRSALADGRHEQEGWRLRKDGARFWVHVLLTTLRDQNGQVCGFARISRDMTEHKRQEDLLRRAKDEAVLAREAAERALTLAERANMAKTKFLAAASHDLRQPVQAIYFFTSVLQLKLRGHPAQTVLNDLQGSLEGLNILLDSLLDVSKLDAGLVLPKETDFSVTAILDRMAAEYGPLARDKGLDLTVVPSSRMVRSDPALLSRIVQNLVANAVRYTHNGRVVIGCRSQGGILRIEVWDTGIGIAPERLKEIFEEFTQLGNPERDRSQGLGLGLAIVERLARLLGHRIAVRSWPGRGSMFSVAIPLVDAVALPRRRLPATSPPPRPPAGNRLVVIIDDEAFVLRSLSMVLQSWGYEVLAAASAAEAVERLNETRVPPSVILADYRLREGHTGTEAVADIRRLFTQSIPSIIITGDQASERLREAEASGLTILHKPIQPQRLRDVLSETLAQGRHRTGAV